MSVPRPLVIPEEPVSIDRAVELNPVVRQSTLSAFDDCFLSAYFDARYGTTYWNTAPQARGTIFHRFAAEAMREMKRNDSEEIPVGVALAILEETLEQRGVPPAERVRVPKRELPALRMAVRKFARDNEFSIRRVVDIEKRVEATLTYPDDDGVPRERTISGQLDLLIGGESPEEAIVVDWKDTWALPPRRHESAEDPGLSYHGYFQQRLYGWLVMKTYPTINAVTLREFYVRKTAVRPASIARAELETVEKELADDLLQLDRLVAAGRPKKLRFPHVEPWNPSPGKHCGFCVAAHLCPIERGAREAIAVTNAEEARRAVAELEVAEVVRLKRREALKPWVDRYGPTPSKWSKGRRVLFFRRRGKSSELVFGTPTGEDRPATILDREEDEKLQKALEESAAELATEEEARAA